MSNTSSPALVPSAEQAAFIAAILRTLPAGGAVALRARAGTGKTASIKLAAQAVKAAAPQLVQGYCVFNTRNKNEAAQKLAGLAEARTLNSLGFAAINRVARVTLVEDLAFQIVDMAEDKLRTPSKKRLGTELRVDMRKLLSFARAFLVGSLADLEALALDRCLGPDHGGGAWEYFMDVAATSMKLLADPDRKIIDYDDQIWLPVYHGLSVQQFDVVYVDEGQDLSPAKFALARMALKPGGTFVVVGDDRQAIYGFAGADPDSLPKIIEETGAEVLPLTVTYRCPKSVVALAQGLVGDYTAHESAPEGLVTRIVEGELLGRLVAGDTVVSRSNAPIVSLCLRLLAAGTSAKVLGKSDVAEQIKKLVEKSKAEEIGDLLAWVSDWSEREVAKLVKAGKSCDVVCDKRDCVFALAEGVFSVRELLARIDRLFTDAIEGRVVLLTSTHKAKGLEWDRVYLLADTYRADCSDDPQEANLLYVGITRAKAELVLVRGEKKAAY